MTNLFNAKVYKYNNIAGTALIRYNIIGERYPIFEIGNIRNINYTVEVKSMITNLNVDIRIEPLDFIFESGNYTNIIKDCWIIDSNCYLQDNINNYYRNCHGQFEKLIVDYNKDYLIKMECRNF